MGLFDWFRTEQDNIESRVTLDPIDIVDCDPIDYECDGIGENVKKAAYQRSLDSAGSIDKCKGNISIAFEHIMDIDDINHGKTRYTVSGNENVPFETLDFYIALEVLRDYTYQGWCDARRKRSE